MSSSKKLSITLATLILGTAFILSGCLESKTAKAVEVHTPAASQRKTDDCVYPAFDMAGKNLWTCPMHPDEASDKPGNCSICGMELTPINQGSSCCGTPTMGKQSGHDMKNMDDHHSFDDEL